MPLQFSTGQGPGTPPRGRRGVSVTAPQGSKTPAFCYLTDTPLGVAALPKLTGTETPSYSFWMAGLMLKDNSKSLCRSRSSFLSLKRRLLGFGCGKLLVWARCPLLKQWALKLLQVRLKLPFLLVCLKAYCIVICTLGHSKSLETRQRWPEDDWEETLGASNTPMDRWHQTQLTCKHGRLSPMVPFVNHS